MSLIQQPLAVGGLTLHNRLVLPPMTIHKGSEDGQVTPELTDYYAQRARGDAIGLIILEHCYINAQGHASQGQLSAAQDRDLPGLTALAQVLHQGQAKAFAQINHVGGVGRPEFIGQAAPLAPSAIRLPNAKPDQPLPQAMTAEQLRAVIDDFAAAARRVQQAGFDGVEIHSAHGYLLGQFYSPLGNHRQDAYGGPRVQDRIRLHLQVIRAVRQAVGPDYPVALRLGARDYLPGGSSLQDAVTAAQAFAQAGIDLLDVSGNFCGYVRPGHGEPGYFADAAQAIKQAVSIPVILTGGVTALPQAERLLQEQKADLIGVGRPILKDADWARREMAAFLG